MNLAFGKRKAAVFPSLTFQNFPTEFFFGQLLSFWKSSFYSVSQNSFWQISESLVLFHSSQEEWIHQQGKGEELGVHNKWTFLYYSIIHTVDVPAILMEPFGTHVYMFKRIIFFSSVGAEFLLMQLFIRRFFRVKWRKVRYKRKKRKFNILKITKNVIF